MCSTCTSLDLGRRVGSSSARSGDAVGARLCVCVDVYFAAGAAQFRPHSRRRVSVQVSKMNPAMAVQRAALVCFNRWDMGRTEKGFYYGVQTEGIMRRWIIPGPLLGRSTSYSGHWAGASVNRVLAGHGLTALPLPARPRLSTATGLQG